MEQATVSRALKPLIRDGYIVVNEGADKREKLLSLSSSGKALYKQALTPWQLAQQELKQKLGPEMARALQQLGDQVGSFKSLA